MINFKSEKNENGTLVIRASGQLDNDTNQYFFECVKDEIEAGNKKIVINLADLGYISSIGLGALVRARSRAAKAGGTIFLADIENQVLEAFHLVNFDKLFNIYETEEEAIEVIESST